VPGTAKASSPDCRIGPRHSPRGLSGALCSKAIFRLLVSLSLVFAFLGNAIAGTPTTTTVSASSASETIGQTTQLTATVVPSGGTGTVTFFDDGVSVGAGSVNGAGVATLSVVLPSSGSRTITATYNGDASHDSSTSTGLAHTIDMLVAASWIQLTGENGAFDLGSPRVVRYGYDTVWVQRIVSASECTNDVFGDPLVGTYKQCEIPSTTPSYVYAPMWVLATDTLPDRVVIGFTAPDQSSQCSSVNYVVLRNGAVLTTITTIPITGGDATYDDTTGAMAWMYDYSVRAVCVPSNLSTTSASDSGTRVLPPLAVTGVSASDGTFTSKINVTFTAPDQTGQCPSVSYAIFRDDVYQGAITTISNAGGVGLYEDFTAGSGTHTYVVWSVCDQSEATAVSSTDTGYQASSPLAVTGVTASDGTFPSKVAVTFSAPDQSSACTSVSYVVTRDGSDLASITTIPQTGGAGSYDDTTASVGTHSYGVRSVCTGGSATSSTNSGYWNGTPTAPTAVAASDGTFSNKVSVTFTAPDQSAQCSAISYVVTRDGTDVGTSGFTTISGGAASFDDLSAPVGAHTYAVRAVCSPGTGSTTSSNDVGYKAATPFAATGLAASDGTFSGKVAVTFTAPDQSAMCSSISYVVTRDGADLSTIATVPLTGGSGSYDDTTPGVGTHSYGVRSVCSPGAGTATAVADTGFAQGTPAAATAVSATDGAFSTKVTVTFTAPNQAANCTSTNYVVTRDGSDLATITTIANSGGAGTYDDTTASIGTHTYGVRSVCTPGSAATSSSTDTGYKAGTPSAVTALAATDGAYSTKIAVTFTAPDQSGACASVSYVVTRDGTDLSTIASIPLTGGTGSFDDTTAAAGTHSYGVRTVCSPGAGTATAGPDTGFWQGAPIAPTAVAASDGTFTNKVAVTFTAPNQSSQCTAISYVVTRDGTDVGTSSFTTIGGGAASYDDLTVPAGVHTYAVRAACAPGGASTTSSTDTGFKAGTPAVATAVTATDGTFATKITVSFTAPDQSANCTSTNYVVTRDGVDQSTISSIANTGGPGTYDDTTASAGTHTYGVRSFCTPGSATANSGTDTGYIAGTPAAATAIAASDGTFSTKVTVTFTAPNQAANCTSTNYVVTRDGVDQTTITTIANSGGAGTYDDLTVSAGTHTYGVRSVCSPGSVTATSTTDTGFKAGTPAVATAVAATDGTFATKITVSFTAPDQSANCTSTNYVVTRDGIDQSTISSIANTGGPGTYDDTTASVGTHTYGVRSVCTPGAATANSATNTGYWLGSPTAPPAVVASDGTFTAKVGITFTAPNQSAQCTSIAYVVTRNGTDIGTSPYTSLSPGVGTFDDTTAVASTVYTYGVRAVCAPGSQSAVSPTTDTGFRQGVAATPTSITASDYVYGDHVAISVVVPNDSAQCTSRDIVIARDGTDITTFTGFAIAGGTATYDDYAATMGPHTYTAKSVCVPGGATSSTVSDSGARRFAAASCSAVSAGSSSVNFGSGVTVPIAATDVQNASLIRFRAWGAPNGQNDLKYYPVTGSGPDYTGAVALSNHAVGTPEYGTLSVELLVTGMNPGDTEQVCATTSFEVVQACATPVLSGPQGTGGLPSTITWSADAASTQWTLYEASSAAGPFTNIGTLSAGTTSSSVPGWPHKFYKLECDSSNAMGNSTSAALEVWGNPAPVVTAQSLTVGNPGSVTVTPAITDPDGTTSFVLTVTASPSNGVVTISGGKFTYTPSVGYAGPDSFTITATDPGGQTGAAVMTADVFLLPPATPTSMAASDGTKLNQVDMTWGASANAQGYRVFRGTSAADPAPVQIADVSAATLSYSDTSAAPGVQSYYSVLAYNGAQMSARSTADLGYADTPISALSASASTDPGTPVDVVPAYTDPDPGDVPTLAVLSQPANGAASIVAGKIRYVPNGSFIGSDTFTIRGTDRAGQSATGTASVQLTCKQPNLAGLASLPNRVFSGAGYRYSGTYDTGNCPQAFSASYRLLQGTTVLDTASIPSVPAGTALGVSFDRVAPVTPGTYTAEITITNTSTGANVIKTASVVVGDFRSPSVNWDKANPVQYLDSATLQVGSSPDCTITTSAVAAQSDTSLCLAEVTALPTGVVQGTQGPPAWRWSGVPSAPGTFSTQIAFSAYDVLGTKRTIATINKPIDVVPLASMVFTAPTSITIKQYLDIFTITPAQTAGPSCQLASDLPTATAQAQVGTRSCVLEWGTLPPDTFQSGVSLKGSVFDTTTRSVDWTVSAVDASGTKYQVATGSTTIVSTATDLSFDLTISPAAPYAIVTPVTIAAKSVGADSCVLTALESVAISTLTRRCLFEFGAVPGLSQPSGTSDAILKGTLQTAPVTTVPYTVSLFLNGVKHQVASGSKDFAALVPSSPQMTLAHVREIGPDTYAVSLLGGPIGVLSATTNMGQVNGSALVAGDAAATNFILLGTKNSRVLFATPAPLYSARTVDISLALASTPTFSSTKQVTIVSVPRDGLRLRLDGPPKTIADTATLTAAASVVQVTPTGLAYVPGDAGPWVVAFGEMGSNGVFNPLTSEVPIDPVTGQATAPVPLGTNTILRLTARARAVSTYPGYTASLTSPTQVISIVKGTPIAGSLIAMGSASGPAPFLGVMRVQFGTLADHAANLNVAWSRSEDDGATWTPITTATGLQYAERMVAGKHLFKVQFTNRNTNETSESPPLLMEAYDVPKLAIDGPGYMLPGSTATFTARAMNPDLTPMVGAIYEWSLALASSPTTPLATGSGNTVPYSATDVGVYRLTVRARSPSTNASDPKAWSQTVSQVVVGTPSKPIARIVGPLRLETGKTGVYVATVSTTFNLASSNLQVAGEWTLPDGSKVVGTTLNWTPTPADLAVSARPNLSYRAWIVGYEADTSYTGTVQVSLWQYVWPNWRVVVTQGGTVAPANAQFTLLADNPLLVASLEGLTYTWTVPSAIRVSGTPASKLTGIVDYGGTYPAEVVVSDSRGNSTSLTASVTMNDAPPLVVDLLAQNLSKWSHAPILLGASAKTTGGHPLDSVTTWTYSLDGVQQAFANQSTARFSLDAPGTYNVRVDVGTRMGASATKTVIVNVPPNVAAACAPTGVVAANRRSIALKSNCADTDGTITHYSWSVNGTPVTLSVGSAWTLNLPANQAWPVTVEVTATDDAGAASTASATFN